MKGPPDLCSYGTATHKLLGERAYTNAPCPQPPAICASRMQSPKPGRLQHLLVFFALSFSQLPAGLNTSHLAQVWFKSLLPLQAHLFSQKLPAFLISLNSFLPHLASRLCLFATPPLAQRVSQRKLP